MNKQVQNVEALEVKEHAEKMLEGIGKSGERDVKAIEEKGKRKVGVTSVTLKALSEQAQKVREDELLTDEECKIFEELVKKIKLNWIDKKL